MGADCMKTQMSHLTRVHIGWSRECHDWVTIRVDSEVKEQIKKYSNLEDHIIHTNGLVIYGTMRECGFGVYLREAFTATAAGAFTITTTIKHENGDRSGHTDHHIAGKAASKISHNPNRLTDFAQKNLKPIYAPRMSCQTQRIIDLPLNVDILLESYKHHVQQDDGFLDWQGSSQ